MPPRRNPLPPRQSPKKGIPQVSRHNILKGDKKSIGKTISFDSLSFLDSTHKKSNKENVAKKGILKIGKERLPRDSNNKPGDKMSKVVRRPGTVLSRDAFSRGKHSIDSKALSIGSKISGSSIKSSVQRRIKSRLDSDAITRECFNLYMRRSNEWKPQFTELVSQLLPNSKRRIFPNNLARGNPLKMMFNNSRFAILYFDLYRDVHYLTKEDCERYFPTDTSSNYLNGARKKYIEVFERKKSKDSLIKRLNFDDSIISLPLGQERKEREEPLDEFDEMCLSISSDEPAPDKLADIFENVDLSGKKFLGEQQCKEQAQGDDDEGGDLLFHEHEQKDRYDQNLLGKRDQFPELNPTLISLPNPYKSSYTVEYDKWRASNLENLRNRRKSKKMISMLTEINCLSCINSTSFYRYEAVRADALLKSRFNITFVVKAIKVSGRARSKLPDSSSNNGSTLIN